MLTSKLTKISSLLTSAIQLEKPGQLTLETASPKILNKHANKLNASGLLEKN